MSIRKKLLASFGAFLIVLVLFGVGETMAILKIKDRVTDPQTVALVNQAAILGVNAFVILFILTLLIAFLSAGRVIRRMLGQLDDVVAGARRTAEQLTTSSRNLVSASKTVNASAQDMSVAVQQMAKGLEVQADKVQQVSGEVARLNKNIDTFYDCATTASKVAGESTVLATLGQDKAKKAIEVMNGIYASSMESSNLVQNLGKKSEEISDIVKVINHIAEQTNLLALNAAIEAARAGEAGRGFAVVSEEVRKLAESSAKASDEISILIKNVNTETVKTVESMKNVYKLVSDGKEAVQQAGNSFEQIVGQTNNVTSVIKQIDQVAHDTRESVGIVFKSIVHVATTAEEGVSASLDTSASIKEVSAAMMQQLASSSEELNKMAADLQELIQRSHIKS
jgi:methyl-accepting chemotaxis protein